MKKIAASFIKSNGIEFLICFIVLLCAFIYYEINGAEGSPFVDWTIFTSVIIVVMLSGISKFFSSLLMGYFEDSYKLNLSPVSLTRQYSGSRNDFIEAPEGQGEVVYPVVKEPYVGGMSIEIRDSLNRYAAPKFVEENFDSLFEAHSSSNIYNQLNIRVDNWYVDSNKFLINTSRTTYFDSLVTNRAMDYQLESGLTIRSKLEPGPFVTPLKDSLLSNHLGFNGHVESSDGWIIMVKRGRNLSIGKSTYGNSVGASLKVKYSLLDKESFSEAGLVEAIKAEIFDELKIEGKSCEKIVLSESVIAAYRDMVEGGKPQLLFYVQTDLTREEIENSFNKKVSRRVDKNSMLEDGESLIWLHRNDISKVKYFEDGICAPVYSGGQSKNLRLKMLPSAVASLIMLQEYLERR